MYALDVIAGGNACGDTLRLAAEVHVTEILRRLVDTIQTEQSSPADPATT